MITVRMPDREQFPIGSQETIHADFIAGRPINEILVYQVRDFLVLLAGTRASG
jgi:hypothetical protein